MGTEVYELPKKYYANTIWLARCSRGYTNAYQFARKIGISQAHLSKLESGKTPITDKHIEKIAEVTKYPKSFFEQIIVIDLPISLHAGEREYFTTGK